MINLSDDGPLRQVRDPGGLESEGLTLRSGNTLRGRLPQTSQMSETQASLESTVTAAQDQSGLGFSESPPVLSPMHSYYCRTAASGPFIHFKRNHNKTST